MWGVQKKERRKIQREGDVMFLFYYNPCNVGNPSKEERMARLERERAQMIAFNGKRLPGLLMTVIKGKAAEKEIRNAETEMRAIIFRKGH